MADVLSDWQKGPSKSLTMTPIGDFLLFGAATSARTDYLLCYGYAQVKLPSVGANDLSLTLIHESAHGVSSEIRDKSGYRTGTPASFYSASVEERLKNADHYRACIELFQGLLTDKTWDDESARHSTNLQNQGGPNVKTLLTDITTVVGHARLELMTESRTWARKERAARAGKDGVEVNALLGGSLTAESTNQVVLERIIDVLHQVRRFQDVLKGVGAGEISYSIPGSKSNITPSGGKAFVLLGDREDVRVELVAEPGTSDAQLRGLLLKGLLSKCLSAKGTQNAARKVTAAHVVELYKLYNGGKDPIGIDLTATKRSEE